MEAKRRSASIASARSVWAIILVFTIMLSLPVPASADDRMEADQLVEKARMAFDTMVTDPKLKALVNLLKNARGVFICPDLLKGAFVAGVSGGSGVFLARSDKKGPWSDPAFYTIGGASFGLQIGAEASEVILVVMSERGVTSLLSNSAKLGVGASVATGPVGIGASAETANVSADIISFSRSKGLYGGVSLSGAGVVVREGWNDAFYGKKVTPVDILIKRDVTNPKAAGLVNAVKKNAGK